MYNNDLAAIVETYEKTKPPTLCEFQNTMKQVKSAQKANEASLNNDDYYKGDNFDRAFLIHEKNSLFAKLQQVQKNMISFLQNGNGYSSQRHSR